MGLEIVEMTMALEETFGIDIPDRDMEKFITPQDMVDYIIGQIEHAKKTRAQAQSAFFILRDELLTFLDCQSKDIHPETRLLDLASHDTWKEHWIQLWEKLNAGKRSGPDMERPLWMRYFNIWGTALLSVLICYWTGILYMVIPALFGWMVLYGSFTSFTISFAKRLPRRCRRIQDIVDIVQSSPRLDWDEDKIKSEIKAMIVEHLGISEKVCAWDAKFIEDLGCG